jgi:hypothetical protein
MSEPSTFLAVLAQALDGAGVPFMLAGSFASSMHGAPRATQDIDLVIDPTFESLDGLLALLPSERLYVDADVARDEFRRRGQFNVIDLDTGWKADFIFRKARRFSRSELDRRVTLNVLGLRVPVASAEDTILAKLEWAKLGESERQLRDVRGILEVRGGSLDRAYLERWLDELGVRDLWRRVEQGADLPAG